MQKEAICHKERILLVKVNPDRDSEILYQLREKNMVPICSGNSNLQDSFNEMPELS